MDDEGIVEQGSEDEIKALWVNDEVLRYDIGINGDLRLVEIHDLKR